MLFFFSFRFMSRFVLKCLPGIGDSLPSLSPDACSALLLLRVVIRDATIVLEPSAQTPTPILTLPDETRTALRGLPEIIAWTLRSNPSHELDALGRHLLSWTRSTLTPSILYLLFGTDYYGEVTRRVIYAGTGWGAYFQGAAATARTVSLGTAQRSGILCEASARKALSIYLNDLRGILPISRTSSLVVDAVIAGQLMVLHRVPWKGSDSILLKGQDDVTRSFVDRVALQADWVRTWPPLESFDSTGRWAVIGITCVVAVLYFVSINLDAFTVVGTEEEALPQENLKKE